MKDSAAEERVRGGREMTKEGILANRRRSELLGNQVHFRNETIDAHINGAAQSENNANASYHTERSTDK